jgi:AcrR family transcriptional regulator
MLTATDVADLNLSQVALRAGVTPPLANYYFKNRNGLMTALLEERVAPRIDALITATHAQPALPVARLTRLMQRLIQLAATDAFLCRCLLLPAAGSLRERLRASFCDLLQQAQASGQLRADLPHDYLGNALLGLCLFPFMDSGFTQDPARHAATLTLQHAALLQDGILPRTQRQ